MKLLKKTDHKNSTWVKKKKKYQLMAFKFSQLQQYFIHSLWGILYHVFCILFQVKTKDLKYEIEILLQKSCVENSIDINKSTDSLQKTQNKSNVNTFELKWLIISGIIIWRFIKSIIHSTLSNQWVKMRTILFLTSS